MEFLLELEKIRGPLLDSFFRFWTLFGEEYFMLVAICLLYWCVSKRAAYMAGLSAFVSGVATQTLKIGLRIPRPWDRVEGFTPVAAALPTASGYSFPSGHTQTAASVFFSSALYAKRRWTYIVGLCVPLMVALSRMYLGVHTPADVDAALLISAASSVGFAFLPDTKKGGKRDLIISASCGIMAAGSMTYALILVSNGTIPPHMGSDVCKFASAGLAFSISYYIEKRYINFCTQCGFFLQAVKLILGLGIVMLIKEGLKPVLGEGITSGIIRYFLLIIWGMLVYPLIIKKFFAKKDISGSKSTKTANNNCGG